MPCPPLVPISIIPPVSQGVGPLVWRNGSQVARLTVPLNPSWLVYDGSVTRWGDGSATAPVLLPALQEVDANLIAYNIGTTASGQLAKTAGLPTTIANDLYGGAAGEVVYQTGLNQTGFTSVGTTGQLLQSNGSSSPTWIGANNISVTATGSTTPRTLANRFADVLNVKDFGAVGDGVADDSTEIQAAINYCSANSITLFIPSGTYRLLNYISFPSNLNVYGEIGSQLYFDPTMTLSPPIGASAKAFYSNNTSNINISQIRFYSSQTVSKVITGAFINVSGFRLTNCQFDTFGNSSYYAQGLVLFGCDNVYLEGCVFQNCSGDGLAFSDSCQNIFLTNCQANNNGDYGVVFTINCKQISVVGCSFLANSSTNLGADRCSDVVFANNVLEGSSFGIRVARYVDTSDVNSSIVILGNVVRGCSSQGISIANPESSPFSNSGYVSVTANSIYSCSQGVYIADIKDVSVSSNVVYNSTNEGILVIAYQSGQNTSNVSVNGNVVDTATYGIRQLTVSGTMGKISVNGNIITNCSVASVVTTNADVFDGNTS